MRYFSTRSKKNPVTASEAILAGIAADGGLFVPESFPQTAFNSWKKESYQEMAVKLFSIFLTDFSAAAIHEIVEESYAENFDQPQIAALISLDEDIHILELWHGPTLAFKDLALQCLPHLFTEAKKIQNIDARFLVLAATSGDTGKAAMSGFSNSKDTFVAVLYPQDGVSSFQERQMLISSNKRVRAFALKGNFDDCQQKVKKLLQDPLFLQSMQRKNIQLAAANSINIGRLLPQKVYYIHSYLQLVKNYGDPLSVIVPSGNVGNILAARYVKEMGLPLADIYLASNSNKVLFDFLQSGQYDARRKLLKTSSPSMDILVASNMERYLHLLSQDEDYISRLMADLSKNKHYSFDPRSFDLLPSWADEEEIKNSIREIYNLYDYLIDPHTAAAANLALQKETTKPCLIISTASPYKFAPAVLQALEIKPPATDLEQIGKIQELTKKALPQGLKEIMTNEVQKRICLLPDEVTAAIEDLTDE